MWVPSPGRPFLWNGFHDHGFVLTSIRPFYDWNVNIVIIRAGQTTVHRLTATGFLDAAVLHSIICQLPEGTSELMCHPGYVDDQLRRTPTRLLAQREQELQALVRPEIRQVLARQGVALINYRDLY